MERFAMKQVERRRKADPREVARAVARAATVRRPKLRYLAGADARLIKPVRAVMPVRVTEAAVRKILEG